MGEGSVTIDLADEAITLMPDRAAWWGACRTLIVADLHLGKSETMRVAGLPVPDVDLDEQFERLARLVSKTDAARVVVAGDLIHAPAGLTPGLSARVAGRLGELRDRGVSMVLVRGNHDRRIEGVEAAWGIAEIHETLVLGSIRVVHEPSRGREEVGRSGGAFIAGHLHPAMPVGGDKVPAFVASGSHLILPAFSRFTAGGRVLRQPGQRWYPIADGQVMELGVGEGERRAWEGSMRSSRPAPR